MPVTINAMCCSINDTWPLSTVNLASDFWDKFLSDFLMDIVELSDPSEVSDTNGNICVLSIWEDAVKFSSPKVNHAVILSFIKFLF